MCGYIWRDVARSNAHLQSSGKNLVKRKSKEDRPKEATSVGHKKEFVSMKLARSKPSHTGGISANAKTRALGGSLRFWQKPAALFSLSCRYGQFRVQRHYEWAQNIGIVFRTNPSYGKRGSRRSPGWMKQGAARWRVLSFRRLLCSRPPGFTPD